MAGPVKAKSNQLVLYFSFGSFYSERARLGLAEKGLAYTERLVDMLNAEHLQPWYLQMNPEGTVPTLQHGDKYIPDSLAILKYLDQTFGESRLQPDPRTVYGQRVEELVQKLDSINIPQITMGTMAFPELTIDSKIPSFVRNKLKSFGNKMTEEISKLKERYPGTKDLYEAKLAKTQSQQHQIRDRSSIEEEINRLDKILHEVEQQLAKTKEGHPDADIWLFGPEFTLADILLAVTLSRLERLGLSKVLFKDDEMPRVEDYYERLQHRESFKEICLTSPLGDMKPKLPQWCGSSQIKPLALLGVVGALLAIAYLFLRK